MIVIIKRTTLCLLAVVQLCSGFSPTTPLPPSARHKIAFGSRLFIADVPLGDFDDDGCDVSGGSSPSSVFGSPLNKETKQLNRDMVGHIKSIVFDNLYPGTSVESNFARFYALETIARMPYFSYLSVLHLYETLGFWRKADYLKVHFAENWNELHHLLIMEELGGNDKWIHRFFAQHIAFFYYWIVFGVYMVNPTLAYNLNQSIEEEAHQTYSNFLKSHEEYLKNQPAPEVAKQYYSGNDLYLFDAMQLDGCDKSEGPPRRPVMKTLFDAFSAIRDDELEHVKTMTYLQNDSCCEAGSAALK